MTFLTPGRLGKLYEEFAPTRDRTFLDSDLFSYKDCRHETLGSPSHRGYQAAYNPWVFGEIDWVGELASLIPYPPHSFFEQLIQHDHPGLLVRITAPRIANAATLADYEWQLKVLREIITTEQKELGGTTESSWLGGDAFIGGQRTGDMTGKAGCFCVLIYRRCKKTWRLARCIASWWDFPDAIHAVATVNWSSMRGIAYEILTAGTFTLGLGEYGKDFVATREETDDGMSLFFFRRTIGNYIDYDAPVKQAVNQYVCTVFGVVLGVHELSKQAGNGYFTTCLEIGRPPNPSCEVADLYSRQLESMHNIIGQDNTDLGGTVISSWFDQTVSNPELTSREGVFYIIIRASNKASKKRVLKDLWSPESLGRPIQAVVSMERRNPDFSECMQRDYQMLAMQYNFLRGRFPVKDVGVKHRASLLEEKGMHTSGDLLKYGRMGEEGRINLFKRLFLPAIPEAHVHLIADAMGNLAK
ncbi:hypothetical protein C8R43DRAFT_949940 [Mycena crocata]|nr:hypothetical protein C8R43DRAFT_949940 [Mycena crocata]